jgi:hypothetical protein
MAICIIWRVVIELLVACSCTHVRPSWKSENPFSWWQNFPQPACDVCWSIFSAPRLQWAELWGVTMQAITLQWQIQFRHVLIPGSIWHVFQLSISSNVFHTNCQFNANAKPRAPQILQPNWAWNGCKYDHWLMKMCNVCCTDLFGVHKILMFGIDCSLWCGPIAVRL